MKVVCNATPLIHPSAMGRLDVLRELFGRVYAPDEVFREVVTQGRQRPGCAEVRKATWIHRRRVSNRPALRAFAGILGPGEAACIVLAITVKADLLVLDDKVARLHATAQGLSVTGTVGVLLAAAERSGLDFESVLRDPIATGFRLSPQQQRRILQLWRTGGTP